MTRKDYVAIAKAIVNSKVYNSNNFPQFKSELFRVFYNDNSNFDSDRFEEYIDKKILQQQEHINE